MGRTLIDLTGMRFGSWTVLYRDPDNTDSPPYMPMWVCRCDCGTVSTVIGNNLRYGKSTECTNCRDVKRNEGARRYQIQKWRGVRNYGG